MLHMGNLQSLEKYRKLSPVNQLPATLRDFSSPHAAVLTTCHLLLCSVVFCFVSKEFGNKNGKTLHMNSKQICYLF